MYFRCGEDKGADQLRGYREADLRLCFRTSHDTVQIMFVQLTLEQFPKLKVQITLFGLPIIFQSFLTGMS